MKAYLPISHVLLIFSILIFTSCRRNDFFLDFALGMKESEYENLSSRYLNEGILERGNTTIAGYTFDDNFYRFPSGQKGALFAYFSKDSLKEMGINIKGDKAHPMSKEDYKSIAEFFISDYGDPSESGTDSTTNFEYIYWDDFRGARIEIAYSSPEDDWTGYISMISVDKKMKEAGALSLVYDKKYLGFVDDLKTCEEAEDLALKDYDAGRYRFVRYGMPTQTMVNFVDLAKETYSIDVKLGGCISSVVGDCYSTKMIILLSSKFGPAFIGNLYANSKGSINH